MSPDVPQRPSDRLESLIASYLAAEKSGDSCDRDALIEQHPELASGYVIYRCLFVTPRTPLKVLVGLPSLCICVALVAGFGVFWLAHFDQLLVI